MPFTYTFPFAFDPGFVVKIGAGIRNPRPVSRVIRAKHKNVDFYTGRVYPDSWVMGEDWKYHSPKSLERLRIRG